MKKALVLIVFLTACVFSPRASAQGLTVTDFPPTPKTLADMVAKVDLVVIAKVTKVGSLDLRTPGDHPRRLQDLDVLEVLKADEQNAAPTHIVVRQAGGTYRSSQGERAYSYPTRLLKEGEQVVLFLKRVQGQPGQYDIAYGEDGLVTAEPSDPAVALPPGLKRMPELAQHPSITTTQLVAELRALRKDVRQ